MTVRPKFDDATLAAALDDAEGWAEHGYSAESRAYWQGMRDTLRVLTGRTTAIPTVSSDDPAALLLLGPRSRDARGGAESPADADRETLRILGEAPVRFWVCPVDAHRERRDVVTVEWEDGVARCTAPGCGRTSSDIDEG